MDSILRFGPDLCDEDMSRLGDNLAPHPDPPEEDDELAAINRSLALFDADLPPDDDPVERAIGLGILSR